MRIERIIVESLASLAEIQPAISLGEPGLMVISGPTGAGKSTVLDGVCLAIYGRTTRLDQEAVGEIMSRGAGKAMAEVEMTLDTGRFMMRWQIHRARNRPDGVLQAPKCFVIDLGSGTEVATGRRAVDQWIDSSIRLDFNQFCGVVLLAQNEFSEFLMGRSGERAQLLERLTGLDLYTRLGQRAYERHQELTQRLGEEQRAITMIPVLDDAVVADLRAAVADALTREQSLRNTTEAARAKHGWHETAKRLATEVEAARSLDQQAKNESKRLAPDRQRLEQARSAAGHGAPLALINEHLVDVKAATDELTSKRTSLHKASQRLTQAMEELTRAAGGLAGFDAACQKQVTASQGDAVLTPTILVDIRTANTVMIESRDALVDAKAEAAEAMKFLAATKKAFEFAHLADVRLAAEAEGLEQVRQEAEKDLARIRKNGNSATLERLLSAYSRAVEIVKEAKKTSDPQIKVDAATKRLERAKIAVGKALERQKAAKITLTQAREHHAQAERHQAIEQAQKHLRDGEPCPVCGSTDHPGIGQHLPSMGESKRALSTAEAAMDSAIEKLDTDRATQAEIQADLREAVAQAKAVHERSAAESRSWTGLKKLLKDLPATIAEADPSALFVQTREIETGKRSLEAAEKAAAKAVIEAAAFAARQKTSAATLAKHQAAQSAAQATAASTEKQRAQLLKQAEERSIACQRLIDHLVKSLKETAPTNETTFIDWLDELDQRLVDRSASLELAREVNRRWDDAEKNVSALLPAGVAIMPVPPDRLDQGTLKQVVNRLQTSFSAMQQAAKQHALDKQAYDQHVKRVTDTTARLSLAQRTLAGALAGGPFGDEQAVRAALLDPKSITATEKRLDEAARLAQRAETSLDHAVQRGAQHQERATGCGVASTDDPVAIATAAKAAQEALETFLTESGSHRERLRADDAARQERHRRQAGLQSLMSTERRAAELNDVIGNAGGQFFRQVAQAVTLDHLLELTCIRLARLSPRYRIRRAGDSLESLDLLVVDTHLADEERPVATLSGGEKFLVSLALALALADLKRGSGGGVRIGTLFIDEGFGALDTETLDAALAVLDQLQSEQDTSIVLISHVGALQERIPRRVSIDMLGGGRSRVVDHA